ncbi:MAG TPA: folylpolyglutamate synthase/dihydrofolate synthase family protein [Victivallales bacterium]|nr:folylpolyglutamate synthase/dihydrofolate synthase family protein [Victivallales bacterium]
MIRTYGDALKFLSNLEFFGMKLGLEQTRLLAKFAGNPQNKIRFIHVAGTNGKGSVCSMLSSSLSNAGFKTGLYTSPHLISPRERFKIDGIAISEKEFAKFARITEEAVEELKKNGGQATYFEATTVMALLYFKAKKTDFVIWECGMGGRLDATNIVEPELSIISSIGKDHCNYLGSAIAKIAYEKAGIIKKGKTVFCGKNIKTQARNKIKSVAKKLSSPVIFCDKEASSLRHGKFSNRKFDGQLLKFDGRNILTYFPGLHQKRNISLVFNVLKYLSDKYNFNFDRAIEGLSHACLPARMTVTPDLSLVDGAHNPQAVEGLVENLKFYFKGESFCIIFGCLKDKDAKTMLNKLSTVAKEFRFVPILASRKAYEPKDLKHIAERTGLPAKAYESLGSALSEKSERKVIAGSFYLAGEALKHYFTGEEIINWRRK